MSCGTTAAGTLKWPGSGLALAWVLVAGVAGTESGFARLRIESDPPGASVETVTGYLGVTPLSVAERDLYPNRYPRQRADLYGKVLIRRPGCADVLRRISRDDIRDGLSVQLACSSPTSPASPAAGGSQPAELGDRVSERRRRQLRVVRELLDDGIISAQQEAEIRRRILDRH